MKNRILEILSPFLDSSFAANENRSENVLAALKKMSELNFPLRSREYTFGTSLYSDYVTAFEKLSQCFEETSSEAVLVIFIFYDFIFYINSCKKKRSIGQDLIHDWLPFDPFLYTKSRLIFLFVKEFTFADKHIFKTHRRIIDLSFPLFYFSNHNCCYLV